MVASPASRTTERGLILLQPMPKDHGWRVSVNGSTPLETPTDHTDFVGEHTFVFTSPRTPEKIVRRIFLKAGRNDAFRELLVQP